MNQPLDTSLEALVAHLREDADFNRSWTDGRRGTVSEKPAEYVARRIAIAAQREAWADAVTALSSSREARS